MERNGRTGSSAHIAVFSIPEQGHLNPTYGVVAELVRRGHRVSYAVTEEFAPQVVEAGAIPVPYLSTLPCVSRGEKWPSELSKGLALFLDEAVAVLPQQLRAFADDRPNVVLHDIAAHGARALAHHWDIPAIQLSPTHVPPPELHQAFNALHAHDQDWNVYQARFRSFLDARGIDLSVDDYLSRPERCVVTIPRELQIKNEQIPDRYTFVGPCLRARPYQGRWQPPAKDRKVLLVSLGSSFAGSLKFYQSCLEAFGRLDPWHMVLSTGPHVDPTQLGEVPPNVEVHRSVPQLLVLSRASAFITHAGMGSVVEALVHGVPMVAVPQVNDGPINAQQISQLGLGCRLSPRKATVAALREAVYRVSDDPMVAERLREMQCVIQESGGARAAADVVEQVLSEASVPTGGSLTL